MMGTKTLTMSSNFYLKFDTFLPVSPRAGMMRQNREVHNGVSSRQNNQKKKDL